MNSLNYELRNMHFSGFVCFAIIKTPVTLEISVVELEASINNVRAPEIVFSTPDYRTKLGTHGPRPD